jgi:dephospho-CoA kinase
MILGITGGLASGKTEAARTLSTLGVHVVDADEIVRYLTNNEPLVFSAIIDSFGPICLTPAGSLDREKLAAVVFTDEEKRHKLEQILHPPISAVLMSNLRWASLSGQHLVLEIPLLFESGWDRLLENTLTVSCTLENQLARSAARGLGEPQARQRIAAQMPLALKESKASFVVHNNGTLDDLRAAVKAIWEGCIAA